VFPQDWVARGAVRGAYGLKGWIRVDPFATDGMVLAGASVWWLAQGQARRSLTVEESRRHGQSMLAKCVEIDSKEAADTLRGATAGVARSDFPPLRNGEYYLADLVGRGVVNRQGVELGTIVGLRSGKAADAQGAQAQWIEVLGNRVVGAQGPHAPSLLIPLIDQYVDAIDADSVRVDWQTDW